MQLTRNATRDELGRVALPVETKSYKPVPHLTFIEAILEEADKMDMRLVRENYSLARNGNIMQGELVFKGSDNDIDMMAGLINSYDKSRPAMLGLGGSVVICENGLLIADYSLKRRHTTNVWIDLTELIQLGVTNLNIEYEHTLDIRDKFSEIDLNKRIQAELLGRLFVEEEILTPTMANIVREEITNSKLFPDDTVWSFYNHVTHALKQSHPSEYIDRHVEFHEFMDINFR